jgi:hypothetical protein
MSTTLRLLVEYRGGKPVHEEVHVEHEGQARYRLLQSPGLVLGIAAGDVFTANEDGSFTVVRRAGNVSLQIFVEDNQDDLEQFASREFKKIGGYLDGRADKVLVYTVPVKSGFPAMEKVASMLQERFPKIEWGYGNVYDPADGVTPLNWWLQS